MLGSEKRFIDKLLQAGSTLPTDILFQDPKILLRTLRKRLRMTQQQLAKRVRLPQSYIAKVELGKVSPTVQTLQKIFQGLGCSLTVLLIPEIAPDELLTRQAYLVAQKRIKYVAGTMALEDQQPDKDALDEMILEEQKKLLHSETSKIWD